MKLNTAERLSGIGVVLFVILVIAGPFLPESAGSKYCTSKSVQAGGFANCAAAYDKRN